MLRRIVLIPFFLLLTSGVHAQMRVEIETSSPVVSLGETFTLEVISYVSGDTQATGTLDLADLPGIQWFDIESQSTSRRTYSTITNGQSKSEFVTIFQFTLRPQQAGEYTLGPIQVETSDGPITSNAANITVEEDHSWSSLPLAGLMIFVVVFLLGALILLVVVLKKARPTRVASFDLKKALEQIDSAQTSEELFVIFREFLESVFGSGVHTSTHEELMALSQDQDFHELLRLFQKHRYTPCDPASEQLLKDKLITYLKLHDT